MTIPVSHKQESDHNPASSSEYKSKVSFFYLFGSVRNTTGLLFNTGKLVLQNMNFFSTVVKAEEDMGSKEGSGEEEDHGSFPSYSQECEIQYFFLSLLFSFFFLWQEFSFCGYLFLSLSSFDKIEGNHWDLTCPVN